MPINRRYVVRHKKGAEMTISEKKMQIVIDNYFKSECDINTSIRQAFEKGFRIGVKKGQYSQTNTEKWIPVSSGNLPDFEQNVLIQLECNEHFCHIDDNQPMKYDVARRIDWKHPQFDADYYWDGKYAYNPSHVIAWQLLEPYTEKGAE